MNALNNQCQVYGDRFWIEAVVCLITLSVSMALIFEVITSLYSNILRCYNHVCWLCNLFWKYISSNYFLVLGGISPDVWQLSDISEIYKKNISKLTSNRMYLRDLVLVGVWKCVSSTMRLMWFLNPSVLQNNTVNNCTVVVFLKTEYITAATWILWDFHSIKCIVGKIRYFSSEFLIEGSSHLNNFLH